MKKILVLALFIIILVTDKSLSESDINTGYQVTLAVPTDYTEGFVGRAFLFETDQSPPNFRTAISVEAADQVKKYSCSLDVFLGDVRVWSSGHLSRFYADEKCVLEFTDSGNLRLKRENERVGWKSGTSGQGVKRLSLLKTGNLVLVDDNNSIKWQSFNFPTDIMVWGQRLSSKTRLTSFPSNSTLFYSMEIKDEKIELFLNYGKSKYSYWEYKPLGERNITFVELTSSGLEIFNGDRKFDEVGSKATSSDPLRFLSLDNTTGNLRSYHYSQERGKFEASYQALNSTCDLPLSCEPYGVCTPSGSCSCIHLVSDQKACNEANGLEGKCGATQTEMVELRGVLSVLERDSYMTGGGKEECSSLCNDDCGCVAAQYVEEEEDVRSSGRCFLYEIARGIRTAEGGERGAYMVKVVRGENGGNGKSFGLKRWVIIVVVVVDVFVILVVLGGVGYYIFWRRRKNLAVNNN